ncbi:hypothetical protein Ciccas_013550 [Cichlidogyrus casuarinus]|uniref:Uncharacterized protein n=1 Tax=Cichlidogyrus casuarinus TaxID=1844966 RepID=A0ABD2PKB7_9PLAT
MNLAFKFRLVPTGVNIIGIDFLKAFGLSVDSLSACLYDNARGISIQCFELDRWPFVSVAEAIQAHPDMVKLAEKYPNLEISLSKE